MSRIVKHKLDLDYSKVEGFFSRRSQRINDTGPLSVTMYQTEEIARLRDEYEKSVILPRLMITSETKVLDIGCGTGRWGKALFSTVSTYLGIDFSQAYIDSGLETVRNAGLDPARFSFQTLEATALAPKLLLHSGPFDLIIVAGLTAFLNDKDVIALFFKIAELASPRAVVYVREPVGISQRLTLVEHPSEQLQDHYNVIYRTRAEVLEYLHVCLISNGFSISSEFPLFPSNSQIQSTQTETEQQVFILRNFD